MSSAFTANGQLNTHQKAQDTEREGHTEGNRENLERSARARSPERRRDSSAATDGPTRRPICFFFYSTGLYSIQARVHVEYESPLSEPYSTCGRLGSQLAWVTPFRSGVPVRNQGV